MAAMSRPELVSWSTAARLAKRVATKEPFSASYLADSMNDQFARLTTEAEGLVEEETGLPSLKGPARARVVDRAQWAQVNIESMQRLLGPLLERMSGKSHGITALAGRHVTGAELGAVLGWMSARVLGQYDQLLTPDDNAEEQDLIYYVAPNVLALEKRYGFPPEEFRLWLALHECTHRAQFTGVPWLTPYFKDQVAVLTSSTDLDMGGVVGTVRGALQRESSPESDGTDLKQSGLMAAVAGPEQQAALDRLMGLMSLLEGHGEVVMAKAGEGRVIEAERFHRVLHERRNAARGLTQLIQRLLGMDAKLRQYAQGAAFIRKVEEEGGRELFDRVWTAPSTLPTYKEIAEPSLWVARMAGSEVQPAS